MANGNNNQAGNQAGNKTKEDPFVSQLQDRLLKQADLVSSQQSAIESQIGKAISTVERGQEAQTQRIESKFGRQAEDLREQAQTQRATFREAGRGFATNSAALRQLDERTEKSLRDLEQRKQELILQGEAQAAQTITNLQLQELQFKQKAQQQTFSNLLGLGQFGLQQQRENRLAAAQEQQEQAQISSIALEFGLEVQPGETLESITSRAAPLATEERQLELQKTRQQIAQSRAETQRALQGDFSNVDIESLAMAARAEPGILAELAKDPSMFEKVVNKREELEQQDIQDTIDEAFRTNQSETETLQVIQADPLIENKQRATRMVRKAFEEAGPTTAEEQVTLRDLAKGTFEGVEDIRRGIDTFFGFPASRTMGLPFTPMFLNRPTQPPQNEQ